MSERVLILSDLHMGHPVSRLERVAALAPLLEGVDTVVWNGDTWQEMTPPFRERSAEMLSELDALCAALGVRQRHLPGNHDPSWQGPGWLELAQGAIVVSHGDALMDGGSPWKREILLNQHVVDALWQQYPQARVNPVERHALAREIAVHLPSADHPEGRRLWQRAHDAIHPPQRALKILEAWLGQGNFGHAYCERFFPACQVLIIGHFHQHGLWRRGSRLILNTGSFMHPATPCWVEWHDGWLRFGVIDESTTDCRRGAVLGVWRIQSD